jgi:hypothetical protein
VEVLRRRALGSILYIKKRHGCPIEIWVFKKKEGGSDSAPWDIINDSSNFRECDYAANPIIPSPIG